MGKCNKYGAPAEHSGFDNYLHAVDGVPRSKSSSTQVIEQQTVLFLETVGLFVFLAEIALNFGTVKYTLGKKLETVREIGQDYLRHKFAIDCLNFVALLAYILTRSQSVGYLRLVALLKIPDCLERIERLEVYFIENYYKERYWSLMKVFLFNFCFAHMLAVLLVAMSRPNPAGSWLAVRDLA